MLSALGWHSRNARTLHISEWVVFNWFRGFIRRYYGKLFYVKGAFYVIVLRRALHWPELSDEVLVILI